MIRRYGTQSVMKVGLNQPIMRDVLGKLMSSAESDVQTESVSEDSVDEHQIMRKLPVRRAKKGLKRLMGRTESKIMNQKVVKSKANAKVAYGTVMCSEANEIGLENLLEISWRVALQKYFDETMHAPAKVATYPAYPCARTDLQVHLAWCLIRVKRSEYEANNDSKSKEQELELMEDLRVLISRDDSAIAWAKRKDSFAL